MPFDPAKLAKLVTGSHAARIGGKGSVRRKSKHQRKSTGGEEDKKLDMTLNKLGVRQIPETVEVNLFTQDGNVIHFKSPSLRGNINANTYVVSGRAETHKLQDLLPGILSQLGGESLEALRQIYREQFPDMEARGMAGQPMHSMGDSDDDEVPDLITAAEAEVEASEFKRFHTEPAVPINDFESFAERGMAQQAASGAGAGTPPRQRQMAPKFGGRRAKDIEEISDSSEHDSDSQGKEHDEREDEQEDDEEEEENQEQAQHKEFGGFVGKLLNKFAPSLAETLSKVASASEKSEQSASKTKTDSAGASPPPQDQPEPESPKSPAEKIVLPAAASSSSAKKPEKMQQDKSKSAGEQAQGEAEAQVEAPGVISTAIESVSSAAPLLTPLLHPIDSAAAVAQSIGHTVSGLAHAIAHPLDTIQQVTERASMSLGDKSEKEQEQSNKAQAQTPQHEAAREKPESPRNSEQNQAQGGKRNEEPSGKEQPQRSQQGGEEKPREEQQQAAGDQSSQGS